MESFFDSVPDALKLKLVDGTILQDTAIIPNFLPADAVAAAWDAVCALPACATDAPLVRDVERPQWVTGESKALNYRGRAVPRDKMWYQRDVDKYLRYGYTGWQWGVSAGTYRLGAVPLLESLVSSLDAKMNLKHAHNHVRLPPRAPPPAPPPLPAPRLMRALPCLCLPTARPPRALVTRPTRACHTPHAPAPRARRSRPRSRPAPAQWIVTRYETGQDCIGMHSDKVKDWAPGSAFCVIKMGAPRHFVFTQEKMTWTGKKDEVIFNQVLEPGTAVIVGYDANQRVKHGVPASSNCGPSGSIVGRCIATALPWGAVDRQISKRALKRSRE
jgi:hypothetical protein